MYQRCLFCRSRLGRNETVEAFQTGRRLAFDQAKGRLWVVCRTCSRWNLTPLEERWEAIEQCERTFRDTPLRKSTDNIGLARAKDGTDLIRIGKPLLPEFAAWRYQGELLRRHRRRQRLAWAGAAGTWTSFGYQGLVFSKVLAGSPWLLGTGIVFIGAFAVLMGTEIAFHWKVGVGRARRVLVPGMQPLRVRGADAGSMRVLPDERSGWKIRLPHTRGVAELTGAPAVFAAGLLLPRLSYLHASPEVVRQAIERVGAEGGPEALFASIAKENQGRYGTIRSPVSLVAAEISAHQSAESEHLMEHLRLLETQWRDAENIAAIADDLLVPEPVTRRLDELRDGLKRAATESTP